MKIGPEFLNSWGTNAPAGLANEFKLSTQPFASCFHIFISCKWLVVRKSPCEEENKNTSDNSSTSSSSAGTIPSYSNAVHCKSIHPCFFFGPVTTTQLWFVLLRLYLILKKKKENSQK